jgi:hypothetical protein
MTYNLFTDIISIAEVEYVAHSVTEVQSMNFWLFTDISTKVEYVSMTMSRGI